VAGNVTLATVRSRIVPIPVIVIDPPTVDKIKSKHNVTADEVEEALLMRLDVEARWEDHPKHGRRVVAIGSTATRRELVAALEPIDVDEGIWRLKTARWLRR